MIDRAARAIGRFAYRFRILMVIIGIALFGVVCYTQSLATISYTNDANGDTTVTDVFPEDTLVILVRNDEADGVIEYVKSLTEEGETKDEHILEVQAYYNTLGLEMTPSEIVGAMGMDGLSDGVSQEELSEYIGMVYYLYDTVEKTGESVADMSLVEFISIISGMDGADMSGETMALYDFVVFAGELLSNEQIGGIFSGFIGELGDVLTENLSVMEAGKAQLVGENYSRITLYINYVPESDEIYDFYDRISADLDGLTSEYYLIGNTAMSYELSKTFRSEYVIISIVTAVVIFVIVCLTFRKFSIPVLLVCIIECAIFITMSFEAMIGSSMYFIALIIVQCILMGSMVDYGILMSTYYREVRATKSKEEALPEVMTRSIRAILTSALVMIAVTFILGAAMSGALADILFTLGIGTVAAAVLVIFFLPSLLSLFDRLIMWDWYGAIKRRRAKKHGDESLPAETSDETSAIPEEPGGDIGSD
ncbi:MAG: MMPL family transporter [Clostridia bacterium]|nr:MMPL family transporter [Clostridia bacterium]